MDLLAKRDVQRLEERIHVLPAVELTEATELRGYNREEGIAGPIAVDELLDVCGFDLAAVVDDLAVGVDERLREVQCSMIDFREAEGDVAAMLKSALLTFVKKID